MTSKGILAFDVDGTLTHRLDWIDPKVVKTLEGYLADDWEVVLITGRLFSFAWKILRHLPFPYLLGVQNGADILEMPSRKVLRRNYLSAEILPQVEKAYEGIGEDFIIYTGVEEGGFCYYRKERFAPKTLKYLKILENLGGSPWKESDFSFEEGMTFPLIKCFGKQDEMAILHERLKEISYIEVSMIRDPIDPNLYLNLITHPEANKGGVVHFLRDYFQTPLVIAAGDDRNDAKMLKEADVAIVIETAPKEVLALADIQAKTADQLGIIPAIEEAIIYAHS